MECNGEQVYENPTAIPPTKCKHTVKGKPRSAGPVGGLSQKAAPIVGLVLLLAVLVTMIGLHFQQKSELEKEIADITNMTRENYQQLSEDLKELTNEITVLKNTSQELRREQTSMKEIVAILKSNLSNVEDNSDSLDLIVNTIPGSCRNASLQSAKSRRDNGGVFDINIISLGRMEVFCDVTTDGGNWIVFQRRMDGSVDFYRDWSEYVYGFGDRSGEFWLGLEAIHQLTKAGQHEFRVDMVNTDGNRYYVNCSSFRLEAASDNYRLKVSGCSGTARVFSLTYQNYMPFTTRDRDNDQYGSNCAITFHGAWWYNSGCHHSNLNGQYGVSGAKGLQWDYEGNMRFTEMKVRQKL